MTMLVPKIQTRAEHPFRSLDAFFASIKASSFSFTLENCIGGLFVSPKGFMYEVPAFSFTDQWQQPISGTIQVRVLELTDKRALLYAGYTSASDRCLLDMDCCLELQIISEANAAIYQMKPIRVSLPSGKNKRWFDLEVYEKKAAKIHYLEGEMRQVWSSAKIPLLVQKNGLTKTASFYLSNAGSYLIGKKIQKSRKLKQRAMISVAPDQDGPALANIQAYLVFHESDTIAQLSFQRGLFSAFHLPKGKKVSLLMIGLEDGQFYFHRSFLGPLCNQRVECRLQPMASHQLQAELQRMIF